MIWFTSDHHLGHANIIKYCNRPFSNVEEMDQELIRRWNEVVNHNDIVYHLGDLTLGDARVARNYVKQLNGNIRVLGADYHHDKRWIHGAQIESKSGIKLTVLQPVEVLLGLLEVPIVLCHFPFAIWDRKHFGSIHLHGHSHCNYKGEGKILDVGADCWSFYPMSLDEIRKRFE